MSDQDEAVRALLDRDEIHRLLTTYTRGLDRRDERMVASVYHPDAVHEHGMFRGTGAEFAEYALRGLRTMERTMHCLWQSLIDVHAANRASGETYAVACHRVASSKGGGWADHNIWVRYIDTFERRDGGPWLIASRTVVYEWGRVDQVDRQWNLTDAYVRGTHDATDPVHAILGVKRMDGA
ncbi:hypothetical protein GCM10009836_48460 [Pseudonocardia ailaonensis]|uniref:SnoaL-like domain-containing protein n=1 Tax=Pseudonocardia ailaonensis TaxID=367279 RepID=A0ABN2NEC7_9PSEU